MSGDDAAAAPIDGRVEWRARSGGISSPSSAPLGCRRDALMLSGVRLALCTRKSARRESFFCRFCRSGQIGERERLKSVSLSGTQIVFTSHNERWSALKWREIVLARSF